MLLKQNISVEEIELYFDDNDDYSANSIKRLVEEACPQLKTPKTGYGYWEFFKCESHADGRPRSHKLVSAGLPQNLEELKE